MIIRAWHLDYTNKKEETRKLTEMMSIIRRQYGGDDIVCFGDLNLHP